MSSDKTLDRLVREDQAIEHKQDSAILALMEHRWKAVNEHGYSMRAYARAIGRSRKTVHSYIHAWPMWQSKGEGSGSAPSDYLILANMSAEQAEATEIVAQARSVSIGVIGKEAGYRAETRRVRADIEEGAERFTSEGIDPATARERAAEAVRERAIRDQRVRERQADRRAVERENKSRAFRSLEYELLSARKRLQNALQLARESDLKGTEYIEPIEHTLGTVRHVLELVDLAITGESGIDWDAELSKLID